MATITTTSSDFNYKAVCVLVSKYKDNWQKSDNSGNMKIAESYKENSCTE